MTNIRTILLAICLTATLQAGAQALIKHPWQGKRVAYFGDSITDPRNSGSQRKWWNWLQDWLGIVFLGDNTELHLQEGATLLGSPDLNDYNAAIPIGEWYTVNEDSVEVALHKQKETLLRRHRTPSMNKNTYRGRINIALQKVKQMFPDKQVVLLTPIHRGFFYGNEKNIQPEESYTNDIGLWLDDYVQSVKEAANIWAVPVIDLNASCGIFPLIKEHAIYCHNDKDELHPNDKGHIRMAKTVMYQLLALPCTFEE